MDDVTFVRELGTTRKVNGKCRFSRYASTEKQQQHNSLVSAVLTLDDLELYKFEFSENFLGISQISEATTAKR